MGYSGLGPAPLGRGLGGLGGYLPYGYWFICFIKLEFNFIIASENHLKYLF